LGGFKVLSLFNGISCGKLALERAGISADRYVSYEIDQYANQIAKKNYPNDEYFGDVSDADFTQYKGFDLVIGGSPCTSWAICKNGRETTSEGIGFELFSHFVRAVKKSECNYFLYENNFSIHKNIKLAITKALGVDPIMINSSLVSAQSRQRMYWTNIPGIEQPKDKGILLKNIVFKSNDPFIKELLHTQKAIDYMNRQVADGRNHWDFAHHSDIKDDKSATVVSNFFKGVPYNVFKDWNYIRKFHPIECERLQTLPDNWTEGISNTQRYKCIGNGWTVDIIAHIFKNIPESAKNAENCEIIEFPSKIDESENMAS